MSVLDCAFRPLETWNTIKELLNRHFEGSQLTQSEGASLMMNAHKMVPVVDRMLEQLPATKEFVNDTFWFLNRQTTILAGLSVTLLGGFLLFAAGDYQDAQEPKKAPKAGLLKFIGAALTICSIAGVALCATSQSNFLTQMYQNPLVQKPIILL